MKMQKSVTHPDILAGRLTALKGRSIFCWNSSFTATYEYCGPDELFNGTGVYEFYMLSGSFGFHKVHAIY